MWRTHAEEHRQFDTELRTALGDRYERVLAQARTTDLDRAIGELVECESAAQPPPDAGGGHRQPRD
jgi:hypothetical protein